MATLETTLRAVPLASTAALTTSAIVHLHKGRPVTDSLVIAEAFGRLHKNVLQSLDALIADGTISRLESKPRDYTDGRGKMQRMIELTEAGALIAMPFIGGKKSREGQKRLVTAFLSMRDHLRSESDGDWSETRNNVSISYAMMQEALQEVRADEGKATKWHHYANEARLINWVLFGKFEGITRDQLGHDELALINKLEAKNAIWIARGRTYAQRKEALPSYLTSLRDKSLSLRSQRLGAMQ